MHDRARALHGWLEIACILRARGWLDIDGGSLASTLRGRYLGLEYWSPAAHMTSPQQ